LTDAVEKGFWPGGQTTLIQDEEQTRKIDSRIHAPGFVRFNFHFHIPNAVTFSTISTHVRHGLLGFSAAHTAAESPISLVAIF